MRSRLLRSLLMLCAMTDLLTSCASRRNQDAAAHAGEGLTIAVIDRGKGCSTCDLSMRQLGTLGSPTDSILLNLGSMATSLNNGKIVAAPTTAVGIAAIFDSLVAPARQLGRPGEGPGETGRIRGVLPWVGDSVLLLEAFRLTFLSSNSSSGRTVRTSQAITGFSAVQLPTEAAIVLNNVDPRHGRYIIWAATGELRREFDNREGRLPLSADPYRRLAVLGPAVAQGTFWSGDVHYRYHLEQWTAAGELLRTIDRSPSWMGSQDSAALNESFRQGALRLRPLPSLKDVRETPDGLLWVVFQVPTKNWKRMRQDDVRAGGTGAEYVVQPYVRSAYDDILEILDARNGQLLLSARVSIPFRGFLNDSLVYDKRERADGTWAFDIYRIALLHRSG